MFIHAVSTSVVAGTATCGELRQAVLDLKRHLDERPSVLERGDRGALG